MIACGWTINIISRVCCLFHSGIFIEFSIIVPVVCKPIRTNIDCICDYECKNEQFCKVDRAKMQALQSMYWSSFVTLTLVQLARFQSEASRACLRSWRLGLNTRWFYNFIISCNQRHWSVWCYCIFIRNITATVIEERSQSMWLNCHWLMVQLVMIHGMNRWLQVLWKVMLWSDWWILKLQIHFRPMNVCNLQIPCTSPWSIRHPDNPM